MEIIFSVMGAAFPPTCLAHTSGSARTLHTQYLHMQCLQHSVHTYSICTVPTHAVSAANSLEDRVRVSRGNPILPLHLLIIVAPDFSKLNEI